MTNVLKHATIKLDILVIMAANVFLASKISTETSNSFVTAVTPAVQMAPSTWASTVKRHLNKFAIPERPTMSSSFVSMGETAIQTTREYQ